MGSEMCIRDRSTTRGIFAGGYQAPSPNPAVNTLEYITMASAGDATNFGDMTSAGTNSWGGSMSSNTRGVTALGNTPGATNIINYVTIASTGDAADFGDMTTTRKNFASCSSHTRGVIIGGETPTYVNTIEYITEETFNLGHFHRYRDRNSKHSLPCPNLRFRIVLNSIASITM